MVVVCEKFNMHGAKRRLLMLILSLLAWGSIPAHAKICSKDVRRPTTPFEAQAYLIRYGYLSTQDLWRSYGLEALQEGLKVFQEMAHINQSGVLDAPTYQMMQTERCGNLDIMDGPSFTSGLPDDDRLSFPSVAERRKKRFARQETQWQKQHLTYRIMNYTPDLSREQVDRTIATAFKVWSDVTPLTFTPSTCSPVDIAIRFASGDHGDGNPFDGQWGVLGHAYYPYDNSMDWHGDAHFDEAENWILDYTDDGANLLFTAAHEFGHSLGLVHSKVKGALMWPLVGDQSREVSRPSLLAQDDIDGIQSIYGTPDNFDPNELLPITNCETTTEATGPDMPTEASSTRQTTSRTMSTTSSTTAGTSSNSPTTSSSTTTRSSSPTTPSTTVTTLSPSPTTSRTTSSTTAPPTTFSSTTSTSASPATSSTTHKSTKMTIHTTTTTSTPNTSTPASLTTRTAQEHVPADTLPWPSPAPCSGYVDAITHAVDGQTYAFRGNMVFCLNIYGVETGFPKPISTVFPRAPSAVDAAVTVRLSGRHSTERTYLISGLHVWRYRVEGLSRYTSQLKLDWDFPRTLYQEFNVHSDKINAAFTAGGRYSDRAYLVEDDYYWEVKFDKKGKTKAKKNHIYQSKVLDSLPKLDAAFHDDMIAKTYFFSRQTYFRQSSTRRGTLYGPRDTATWWFGCPDNQQATKNW